MSAVLFTISISGDQQIVRQLDALGAGLPDAARAVLRPLGERYRDTLIDETPVGKGPAEGRRRLRERYLTAEFYSATQASYRITNEAPYLRWVLEGRPAVVAPPGKVLRFQIGNQVFYRKRVKAARANPFVGRVRQRMDGALRQLGPALASALIRAYRSAR